MIRSFSLAALFLAFISAASSARFVSAADRESTTEFGITVGIKEILASMFEMSDFWPSVRDYISSDEFAVADVATRKQTVEHLKQLDLQLSKRLFGSDAETDDLIDYLGSRIRKLEYFRRLRAEISDDARMFRLKTHWDEAFQQIYQLPETAREAQISKLTEGMRQEMTMAGLNAATVARAMPLWQSVARSTQRVDGTAAGQVVVAFESGIHAKATSAGNLMFLVIDATEWALICKPPQGRVLRRDFQEAWHAIARWKANDIASKSK